MRRRPDLSHEMPGDFPSDDALAPFAEDAAALLLGDGDMTFLGALALLTSTQIGLLLVSWLFVFRPNALAGLPSLPGRNAAD